MISSKSVVLIENLSVIGGLAKKNSVSIYILGDLTQLIIC